LCPLLLVATS